MSTVMILSAGYRDRSIRLADRRPAESLRRLGWLLDVRGAAAEPGGIPPGRTRLVPNRPSVT
jgi:hypothetical protein